MPKSPPPHPPVKFGECKNCSREFIKRKTSIFCSKKCMSENIEKVHYKLTFCKYCNKEFTQKTYRNNVFCSPECTTEMKKGKNSPTWKGGIKKEKDRRKSLEMVSWRKAVFKRDDYTCQICLMKSRYLEPHHIFFYANFPELRAVLDNGITLCKSCHTFVHKSIKRTYFLKIDKQLLEPVVQHSKYRDWLFQLLLHTRKK